jgi:hypothetical protein
MSAKTFHQKKYFHGNVASARLRPKKTGRFFPRRGRIIYLISGESAARQIELAEWLLLLAAD